MLILIIKISSCIVGVLLIMVSIKGLKLFFNGELAFLGRGYKNKKSAEEGRYINHSKMLKRAEGLVLSKSGKIMPNSCASDSEVFLRLKSSKNSFNQ